MRTLAGGGPAYDAGPFVTFKDGGGNCPCLPQGEICYEDWDAGTTVTGYPPFNAFLTTTDGPATSMVLSLPTGIAVDPGGGKLYIASLSAVQSLDLVSQTLSSIVVSSAAAGGTCGIGIGGVPMSLALWPDGGLVLDLSSFGNIQGGPSAQVLSTVSLDGKLGLLAGHYQIDFQDGLASEAGFSGQARGFVQPFALVGLWVDPQGVVWVADVGNGRIRRISDDYVISVAGGGIYGDAEGPLATIDNPTGIVGDGHGNFWISDGAAVRAMDAQLNVTTLAGVRTEQGHIDGPGETARFQTIFSITRSADGMLYVIDGAFIGDENLAVGDFLTDFALYIRRIDPSGNVTTVAGNGAPSSAYADGPALHTAIDGFLIAVDPADKHVYFTAPFANRIRVLDLP